MQRVRIILKEKLHCITLGLVTTLLTLSVTVLYHIVNRLETSERRKFQNILEGCRELTSVSLLGVREWMLPALCSNGIELTLLPKYITVELRCPTLEDVSNTRCNMRKAACQCVASDIGGESPVEDKL